MTKKHVKRSGSTDSEKLTRGKQHCINPRPAGLPTSWLCRGQSVEVAASKARSLQRYSQAAREILLICPTAARVVGKKYSKTQKSCALIRKPTVYCLKQAFLNA